MKQLFPNKPIVGNNKGLRFIINADDFGLTKPVNNAIFELSTLGVITSTTVMVNMPYAGEIKNIINKKRLGIGIHFNLTQGKPISPANKVRSLISANCNFLSIKELKKRAQNNRISQQEILQELIAQYDKLVELVGDRVSHIDSHQDINKIGVVNRALVEFSQKIQKPLGLRWYNKTYLMQSGDFFKLINPALSSLYKFGLKRAATETYFRYRGRSLKKNFKIPGGMLFAPDNSTRTLLKMLPTGQIQNDKGQVFEIMCHPATSTEGLSETKMTNTRVEEYQILKSQDFQDFVKKNKLISFSDLL